MSEKNDTLPFPRGEAFTIYTDDGNTIDTAAMANLEGREFTHEDMNLAGASGGVVPDRTGLYVKVRCVRNSAATALLGKRFAEFKVDGTTGKIVSGQVMGYAETVGEFCGVVDEFLPAAGVAAGQLFWLVVEGPTKVTSGAAGDTTIGVGDGVIPTTDGKAIGQDATVAAGTATFAQIQGCCGFALEAVAAINTDFLINMRRMGL